ncbi:MAG: hypothetical protein HQ582_06480 [Planctomycetes bacterium]|nr:hypothetical protein [Planctomycetota bacterium]
MNHPPLIPDPTRRRRHPLPIAFLSPSMVLGGAERWIFTLARHLARQPEFLVLGIGARNQPQQDAPLQQALIQESPVPILWGPASFHILSCAVDTLIVWGIRGLAQLIPDYTGEVVIVSHGSCKWTTELLEDELQNAPHARLVAVSEAAAMAYPAGRRDEVTVIPNGFDPEHLFPRTAAATEGQL